MDCRSPRGSYADWSESPGGGDCLPLALAAWVSSFCWLAVIAFLIPRLMLVFPDGGLPTRRWRPVSFAQWVVLFGSRRRGVRARAAEGWGLKRYDNPVGIPFLDFLNGLDSAGGFVALPILLFATLGAAAALIVRLPDDRSGVERLQLELVPRGPWAVRGCPSGSEARLLPAPARGGRSSSSLAPFSLCLTPRSPSGIAVLRYRLYHIDP